MPSEREDFYGATIFRGFHIKGLTLIDAMLGYDLSKLGLQGWSALTNAPNPFDKSCASIW